MKIAVIGLGYVGLPLASLFAEKYSVTGYDKNSRRVEEISSGLDKTKEVDSDVLKKVLKNKDCNDSSGLFVSDREEHIASCDIFIITVPTPVNKFKNPDLSPLENASAVVGKYLKKDALVIYESTVYPGATEEVCVPILEKKSGLVFNKDFYVGYSPERVNPGDKVHTLDKIKKVTSGSTPETAEKVDNLYTSVISAGTFKASSLKTAEAAKVIENSQRDINIAFVNELAMIFDKIGIDTTEVLEAAGTKWNFLPFRPGLVGGHCIGVDPYYLTHKAEELGHHPEVILSGRRINDNIGFFVAGKIIKLLISEKIQVHGSKILVMGITFKENCPDIRNSRVIDVISELNDFGCNTEIYDPLADREEVKKEYGISLLDKPSGKYDGIVLAVAHDAFRKTDLSSLKKEKSIVYDIKSFFSQELTDKRL
ncbi:MAG: nucleotide sugar dehydrogenase [bacterium]